MKFVRLSNTLFSIEKIKSITCHHCQIDVVFDDGSTQTQYAPNEAIAHERFIDLEADLNGFPRTGTYSDIVSGYDETEGPECSEEPHKVEHDQCIRGVIYSSSLPDDVVEELKKFIIESRGGK